MAAGDILSVEILPSGFEALVTIEGLGTGGTYAFDSSGAALGVLTDPSTAKVVFSVTSKGFDATGAATTIVRTVYGTCFDRHSGVEPGGHGTYEKYEDVVGGTNVAIGIVLSEPIYVKDKTGAGNSGTNPTVTILSGFYTQGGTPNNASGAGFAVTNNSTQAYFEPIGQWDLLPYERLDANFSLSFSARHLHGIACVILSTAGGTSGHTDSETVTSESARQRPVTGLYGCAHTTGLFVLSDYTQNEVLTHRARAYPTVGDVELDTNNYTVAGGYAMVEGRGPITAVCDKGNSIRAYACVDFVNGNDGTGVVSTTLATAEASPFKTWKAAVDANATHVYMVDVGPHSMASRTTNKSANFSITTEPHPSQASAVTMTWAANFQSLRIAPCKFKSLTMQRTGTSRVFDGSAGTSALIYEDCLLDPNGFTMVSVDENGFAGVYYKDCEVVTPSGGVWRWQVPGGSGVVRFWLDGVKALGSSPPTCWWRVACCTNPTGTDIRLSNTGSTGGMPRNVLFECNKFEKGTAKVNFDDMASAVTGISFCGNVIEGITASMGGSPLVGLVQGNANAINHVLTAHNTMVGERQNWYYNDGAGNYVSVGLNSTGNIFYDLNTAQDLYHTAGPFVGRTGRWWYEWQVLARGNAVRNTTTANQPLYYGIGSKYGALPTFVNPLYGSTGGGDYHLDPADTVARGILPAGSRVLTYDQEGNLIPNDGTGAAGALQSPLAPPGGSGGTLLSSVCGW